MLEEMKKVLFSVLKEEQRKRSVVYNEVPTFIIVCIVQVRLNDWQDHQ
jgi:hypothetical protein